MLAAQLFDPPLRKRCRPHHHHPITPQATPEASAGPAGNGPTVFIAAVSKPDSIVSLDPVIKNLNADEQDSFL